MENTNYMISSPIEYIDIMTSIAINKNLKEHIDDFDNLKEQISNITTLEDINKYKIIIQEYDKKINDAKKQLTSREQALVDRGYLEEDVRRLSSFNNQDIEEKKELF